MKFLIRNWSTLLTFSLASLIPLQANDPIVTPSGTSVFAEFLISTLDNTQEGGPQGIVAHGQTDGAPPIYDSDHGTFIQHPSSLNSGAIFTDLVSADFFDFVEETPTSERTTSLDPLATAIHHNLEESVFPFDPMEEVVIYMSFTNFSLDVTSQYDYYISSDGNGGYNETRIYRGGYIMLYTFNDTSEEYEALGTGENSYYGDLTVTIHWPASESLQDVNISIQINGDYEYSQGDGSTIFNLAVIAETTGDTFFQAPSSSLLLDQDLATSANRLLTDQAGITEAPLVELASENYEFRTITEAFMQLDDSASGAGSPPYINYVGFQIVEDLVPTEINFDVFNPDGLDSDVDLVVESILPEPADYTFSSSDRFLEITPSTQEVNTTFVVEIIARDSDSLESNMIFVISVVDNISSSTTAPIISIGSGITYTENGPPTPIAPSISVTDPEQNFDSTGRLEVAISSSDAEAGDVISFSPTGNLSLSGLQISYMGQHVATLDKAAANGSDTFGMTFTSGLNSSDFQQASSPFFADPTDVIAAIAQAITFESSEDNPFSSKSITFILTDNTSLVSSPALQFITITSTNDAPEPEDDLFTTLEGVPLIITFSELLSNDIEPDGENFSLNNIDNYSALGGIIRYDSTENEITFETSTVPGTESLGDGEVLTDSFQYSIQDIQGNEASATVTVKISGENTAPIINTFLALEIPESQTYETTIIISDLDSTRQPTLSGTLTEFAELRFNSFSNREAVYDLILRPEQNDIGDHTLSLIAGNPDTNEVTRIVYTFTVVDTFQRPISRSVSDFFIEEDQNQLQVSLFDLFDDPDGRDEDLRFDTTRNSNPFIYESINFNQRTGILTLQFNSQIEGFLDLTIRATDTDGLSANVDLFIGIRNDFLGEMRAAAGTSEKRVSLPAAIQADQSSIESITVRPLATSATTFPSYTWDPDTGSLVVEPTDDPSLSLLSTTFHLEGGAVVEQIFPVEFTEGQIFESDSALENSWFYSDTLGLYFRSEDWAYHPTLGWLYYYATVSDSVYFYSQDHGWLYTTESDFPYIYDSDEEVWKYLYIGPEGAFIYSFQDRAYSPW